MKKTEGTDMKKTITAFALCSCVLAMSACTSNKTLAKPQDTSLEFWVAEEVTDFDFSEHTPIYGMMGGGAMYMGKGYQPLSGDVSQGYVYPDYYVLYTLTSYPDYSDEGLFVTRIVITYPAVSVYGVTCESSLDTFDKTFQDLGCDIQDKGIIHIATYGRSKVSFADYEGEETITVWVEVTNRWGVVY